MQDKSDPVLILYVKDAVSDKYTYVGQTEFIE